MNTSNSKVWKRILPIFTLVLIILAYIFSNNKPTNIGAAIIISDEDTPLASMIDAYFYVAKPGISLDDLSSLTEDMFDFAGYGTVFYGNDIYDDSAAVNEAIQSAPDISQIINIDQTIEWRYLYSYDSLCIVVGEIVTQPEGIPCEAEFYLYNPSSSFAPFTNVSPNMCTYLGAGLYCYTENIYNVPEAVWSQVYREPNYDAPLGEYIEWGSSYIYNGKYVVIGRYVHGDKPILPNLISDEASVYDNTYMVEDSNIIPESPLSFSDVESLKTCEAEIATIVHTEGYRSAGDGGSAEYIISSSAASTPDNTFSIKLNNGNYANLVYDSDSIINVALFGIFPGENISDKFNSAINAAAEKVGGLSFNSGTYYIDKPIRMQSMSYYGNDTVLEVSDTFYTNDDKVFTCKNKTDEFNIELHSIIFNYPVKDGQHFSGTSSMFMVIYNTSHCIIDSCEFNCSNPDGLDKPVHLLWFKQPAYIKNVSITNSKFINACGEYMTTTRHTDGGCLWFSGTKTQLCQVENINISNCTLYSTLADELMCVWYTNTNGFHIDNCDITNAGLNSDNVCGFLDGIYENTSVQNTTFNINAPSAWMLKMGNLWGPSHVNYSNCTFNANAQNLQPYKNAFAVFYVYHDHADHPFSDTSTLTVDNCVFNGNNSTGSFRCLFMTYGTENKQISFNNSSLNNFALRESISNIEKSTNCSYFSSNCFSNANTAPYRLTSSTNIGVEVN